MLVKICGITRAEDASAAVACGACALGFVFWPGSPRCIDPYRARAIAATLPPLVTTVGVFVNQPEEYVASVASLEGGVMMSMEEQTATYKAILAEGVERLKAMGFSPNARLGVGDPGKEIAAVAREIGANLVVVGHRPTGPLARWWFGSVGTYLIEHLQCSVLVAQTEIGDEQFAQLLTTPAAKV